MRRVYPEKPLIGVGAVVFNKSNEILLVKRGNPPGEDMWSIPGGLVEVGETLEHATLRELAEETGIKGKIVEPIDVFEVIVKDASGKVRYHYVIIDFLVEPVNERAVASDDAKDAGWFSIKEALKLRLTKPTKTLLEKLKNGIMEKFPIYRITYTE
ncbi:MAG: NUDIX hydrolase [Candidatus Njordarchaeia archaeon]